MVFTRRRFLGVLAALAAKSQAAAADGREYHVSAQGSDHQEGTRSRPLRTISAAAARALPGDTITVHEGVYRERVAPPRAGASDDRRITYQAAPGERVEISGAEVIKGWVQVQGDVWKVVLPNTFFGDFNPYKDVIHGDWFDGQGRTHHTGAVYLDGEWLNEAESRADLFRPAGAIPQWFGEVGASETTLWAQFPGADPNRRLAEINVRQSVFYPKKTGIDYITVRGFILRRAATPWAPPTAEQMGVIGTHWSKGWIIENNVVSHSACSGIALGKYGDRWDNTSANSAEGYVKTIERAEHAGWSKANIGSHVVRNNTVFQCEQAGIVGSLGPVFSSITGNTIYDIHVRQLYSGAEIAGIKFHAAIDVEIRHNHIYRTYRGLWLDWMAQGTRVAGNLFHDNQTEDLFVEVDHGPFVVDNNFFLSKTALHVNSQGGAFAHNLFCGGVDLIGFDARMTPYMKPHSTQVAGYHENPCGDMRFFNNLFAQGGDLSPFNVTRLPMRLGGNVFVGGAKPCSAETKPLLRAAFDPQVKLTENSHGFALAMMLDDGWMAAQERPAVTSELLGRAMIPDLPFENADGTAIRIDRDYRGNPRKLNNPCPGPIEFAHGGKQSIAIWPDRP